MNKHIRNLWLWVALMLPCLAWGAAQEKQAVMVNTQGQLQNPTNFILANGLATAQSQALSSNTIYMMVATATNIGAVLTGTNLSMVKDGATNIISADVSRESVAAKAGTNELTSATNLLSAVVAGTNDLASATNLIASVKAGTNELASATNILNAVKAGTNELASATNLLAAVVAGTNDLASATNLLASVKAGTNELASATNLLAAVTAGTNDLASATNILNAVKAGTNELASATNLLAAVVAGTNELASATNIINAVKAGTNELASATNLLASVVAGTNELASATNLLASVTTRTNELASATNILNAVKAGTNELASATNLLSAEFSTNAIASTRITGTVTNPIASPQIQLTGSATNLLSVVRTNDDAAVFNVSTNGNVYATGTVKANAFEGDGSALTGVASANALTNNHSVTVTLNSNLTVNGTASFSGGTTNTLDHWTTLSNIVVTGTSYGLNAAYATNLTASAVNARLLGCVADGSTDDTAVLRLLLSTNDAVYLPAGRYKVTEPLTNYTKLLYGDGKATVMEYAAAAGAYPCLRSTNVCEIRDFTIDGMTGDHSVQGSTDGRDGINASAIGEVVIRNMVLRNLGGCGIFLSGDTDIMARKNKAIISNNYATNCWYGFSFDDGNASEYTACIANEAVNCTAGGVFGSANTIIANNRFVDNFWNLMFITDNGRAHSLITGNILNHGNVSGGAMYLSGCGTTSLTINGNHAFVGQIKLESCTNVVFANNVFEASTVYDDRSGLNIFKDNTWVTSAPIISGGGSPLFTGNRLTSGIPILDNATNKVGALFSSTTVTATNGFLAGATQTNVISDSGAAVAGLAITNGNFRATGGTMSGALYSTASTATNGPAENELITAGYVRSVFNVGEAYYPSTNIASAGTNVGSSQPLHTFQSTIPISDARSYATTDFLTNGGYIGSVVTTNTFPSIRGQAVVTAYIGFTGGSASPTITLKPELYYSYDRTNWYGDWATANQSITHGSTNMYQWLIDIPQVTATNATGFYVQRRYKVGTVTGSGTRTLTFLIGTNAVSGTTDASHVTMQSQSATVGNAYLNANQVWTGSNFYSGPLVSGGDNPATIWGSDGKTNAVWVGPSQTVVSNAYGSVTITNDQVRAGQLLVSPNTNTTGLIQIDCKASEYYSDDGSKPALRLSYQGTTALDMFLGANWNAFFANPYNSTDRGGIGFRTGGSTYTNERITIAKSGPVGISNTNPVSTLDVIGDITGTTVTATNGVFAGATKTNIITDSGANIQGATITNDVIRAKSFNWKTNAQTLGSITLGQMQRTNTAAAITLTGLIGASGSDYLSGVLVISNSSAASVLVTWPVEWISNLGPNISAYCTNAEAMVISVGCLPGVMTNAAIIRTRKGSSGVAP